MNQNALISDGGRGTYLFANPVVRQALSLAIDREAIANAVVFAQAADAFVANGIFDIGLKGEFRKSDLASALLNTGSKMEEAKALLTEEGITASDYSFSIKVAAHDEIHVAMTEMICEAWNELGFDVTVEKASTIENNDYFDQTDSVPPDVCDDLFVESIKRGTFEAIALDVNAFTADAYSMLSNYAYAFSGSFYADAENEVYEYDTHINGYNSVDYNVLMEAIYYIPYFASVDTLDSDYMSDHLETKPYEASAIAATRKFSVAVANAKAAINQANADLNPEDTSASVALNTITSSLKSISEQVIALETAAKIAVKDIAAAGISDELIAAIETANSGVSAEVTSALALIATADKDSTDAGKAAAADKEAAIAKALESAKAALNAAQAVATKAEASVAATEAAKEGASKQTLKEAIQAIYTANGITPSTKESDWSKQKSILLHEAEELLMEDLPVIPVVYNQNAILVHKDLSRVDATYYAPAYFRKTKLKNYKKYYYYDQEEEKDISIFKSFPEIKWDEIEG